uniref:Uncharacterized protein n=1 Tax=Timema douglasi TaxID=61478 RepID=A0A7R8VNK2_TIMDO|nr:unnamed protein product [Timema douglasi]
MYKSADCSNADVTAPRASTTRYTSFVKSTSDSFLMLSNNVMLYSLKFIGFTCTMVTLSLRSSWNQTQTFITRPSSCHSLYKTPSWRSFKMNRNTPTTHIIELHLGAQFENEGLERGVLEEGVVHVLVGVFGCPHFLGRHPKYLLGHFLETIPLWTRPVCGILRAHKQYGGLAVEVVWFFSSSKLSIVHFFERHPVSVNACKQFYSTRPSSNSTSRLHDTGTLTNSACPGAGRNIDSLLSDAVIVKPALQPMSFRYVRVDQHDGRLRHRHRTATSKLVDAPGLDGNHRLISVVKLFCLASPQGQRHLKPSTLSTPLCNYKLTYKGRRVILCDLVDGDEVELRCRHVRVVETWRHLRAAVERYLIVVIHIGEVLIGRLHRRWEEQITASVRVKGQRKMESFYKTDQATGWKQFVMVMYPYIIFTNKTS